MKLGKQQSSSSHSFKRMGTRPRLGSKRFRELNLRLSQSNMLNSSMEKSSIASESPRVKFE